jgi:hypothetical protein
MAFLVRPYRRFPLCCSVTYSLGLCKGHGIVWNFSLSGWRLSGNLPLRVGETCSLSIHLPDQPIRFVARATVRWVRGQEYGVESMNVEKQTYARLSKYVERLVLQTGGVYPMSILHSATAS